MNKALNFLGWLFLGFIIFDFIILNWMMLQIASGVDTPHIEFWDKQLTVVVKILN